MNIFLCSTYCTTHKKSNRNVDVKKTVIFRIRKFTYINLICTHLPDVIQLHIRYENIYLQRFL